MGGISQTGIDGAGIKKTKIEDIENIQSTETIDKQPILNIPELLKYLPFVKNYQNDD